MNTIRIIAEIKTTCHTLETEKAELVARVKEIDDRLTGYRMAIDSLEMTIPKEAMPVTHTETVQKEHKGGREAATYEYNGERKTISEWAKASGVNKKTLRYRLNCGMSIKDALTCEKFKKNKRIKPQKVFVYDAHNNPIRQYVNVSAASRDLKLPESTVKSTILNVSKEDQLKSRGYYIAYAS